MHRAARTGQHGSHRPLGIVRRHAFLRQPPGVPGAQLRGGQRLTRALALELRERNITVNAVSLEVHRPCAPDRVADVIAYLFSDHGRHLTGQVLGVGDLGLRP